MNASYFNLSEATTVSPKSHGMNEYYSPCSIARERSPDLAELQKKYNKLEQNYQKVLEVTKDRNKVYEKQKQELENFKKLHERDTKEIERLRGMLGFLKKEDKSCQANLGEEADFSKLTSKNDSTAS